MTSEDVIFKRVYFSLPKTNFNEYFIYNELIKLRQLPEIYVFSNKVNQLEKYYQFYADFYKALLKSR